MINIYVLIVFFVLCVLFINNRIQKKDDSGVIALIQKPYLDLERPQSTTISQKLSDIIDYIPKQINGIMDNKPVTIIRNKGTYVNKKKPFDSKLRRDYISPNPIDNTEYRFIGENPKYAWTEEQVSHHPSHYKSNFGDELTQSGKFFDEKKTFTDITMPSAETHLPDRCSLNENKEVSCSFNNKLQNIPPKLIQDKDNQVIQSIGKGILSGNVERINNNSYQVWNYEDEDDSEIVGASSSSDYLSLDSIQTNYSI
uniref:Uncharacterized protein n=1 Tax=viral metagenome TaxID=1070528 RepID=A0A6C0KYX1_9ZZZZ|tara:strand:+ start:19503 stop:20267 length:765 start_codon:yes stop_codon:yes gene_type:complete